MGTPASVKPKFRWDVLVVGAGPAGAASAITLAQNGWRVLIVEKQSAASFKFSESVPPATVGVIEHLLGSLDDQEFTKQGMAKTVGNVSCWQSAEPEINDFFYTPNGYGLGINRAVFDAVLVSKALHCGACLQASTQFIQCQPCATENANWAVELQSDAGREWHHTKYLVDCSGRRAIVASALGVSRQVQDQLFAYGQRFVAENHQDNDQFTRLEAASQGWWYTNRLPLADSGQICSQRMVVFHTDRDLVCGKLAATPSGFADLLQQSQHISALLEKHGYQPKGKIRGACAASERLDQFAGDDWMAVGDAAQAYDPLSSQGISKALTSATMAGQLIHYALEGLHSFKRYTNEQEQLWSSYWQQHHYYYDSQSRWPDQLFWNRRRQHTFESKTNPREVR